MPVIPALLKQEECAAGLCNETLSKKQVANQPTIQDKTKTKHPSNNTQKKMYTEATDKV